MIRILFAGLAILLLGYLFLRGMALDRDTTLPVFLRVDTIALAHQTDIDLTLHTIYEPESSQLEILTQDYSNLWAHLNHLYATNDILAGKEYYTEGWFRQLAGHYPGEPAIRATRQDERHELHIETWASDGLVCTAIDSNVIFRYDFPGQPPQRTRAHLAVVLLFQGDHWRIDALRVLGETVE